MQRTKGISEISQNPAFFLLLITSVLTLLTLATFNLKTYLLERFSHLSNQSKILGKNDLKTREGANDIIFLKSVLSQNPTYLDGWIELARLEKSAGDLAAYSKAVEKINEISPNFSLIGGIIP